MTCSSSDHPPELVPGQKRRLPTDYLINAGTITIVALALYSLIGFFIIPVVFTNSAPFILPKTTAGTINIGSTSFNPYTFVMTIKNLTIHQNTADEINLNQPLLAIDQLYLDFDLTSLAARALIISEFTLSGLYVHLIHHPNPSRSPTDLLLNLGRYGGQLPYSLQNITIRDSEVIFGNAAGGIYNHAEKIHLTLPLLTNLPDHEKSPGQKSLPPEFSAIVNGKRIASSGKTSSEQTGPQKTIIELDFQNVSIPALFDYLPEFDQIRVEQGLLDIKFEISLPTTFSADNSIDINSEGQVTDLKCTDSWGRAATIRSGSFKATLKPLVKYYKIDSFFIDDLQLAYPGHWQMTIPAIQTINASYQPERLNLGEVNGAGARVILATELFSEDSPHPPAKSREITLQSLDLSDAEIRIASKADATKPGLKFSAIEIHNSGLTSNLKSSGETTVSATMADNGHIALKGRIAVSPFNASLDYQAMALPFEVFRPLLAGFIPPRMTAESISGTGQIAYPDLEISGSATVKAARIVVSPQQDLFSCPVISLNDFRITLDPPLLNMAELHFTKPLFTGSKTDRKQPALGGFLFPAAAGESPQHQTVIRADTVRLTEGTMALADYTAMPFARLKIASLNTILTGMTNQPAVPAPFEMQGTMQLTPNPDDYPIADPGPPAGIAMTGEVTLFGDSPGLKSSLAINNFNLPNLGPYLARLLGYQPDRGQLDLTAEIDLHNHQLTSRNHFAIRKLHLGPSVSGRFNTPLAVALLSDNSQIISLDLEVTGNLNEPSFSYTNSLASSIRNILSQTISSPLSLVTAGNNRAKLQEYFIFPAGKAELNDAQKEQLELLTEALKTRPLLKISIAGRIDPDLDFPPQSPPSGGTDKVRFLKELATSRATVIRESLIRSTISGHRLQLEEPNDILDEEILLDRPMSRVDITPLP